MKEIIAIIRPEKWQATIEAVEALEVHAAIHLRVLGRGRQRGLHYLRRVAAEKGGAAKAEDEGVQFLPKRMVSWLVADEMVDGLVAAVIHANRTDNIGDGKIFVCPLETVSDAGDAKARDVLLEAIP